MSTAEQHAAYRDGLCIDCKAARYSAGRPRCTECHAKHVEQQGRAETT